MKVVQEAEVSFYSWFDRFHRFSGSGRYLSKSEIENDSAFSVEKLANFVKTGEGICCQSSGAFR